MGSINYIFEPGNWKIKIEGNSKLKENDIVYNMIVGVGEDDYHTYEITYFISKDIYCKIIDKQILFRKYPYSEVPIILFDFDGNVITPVNNLKIENDLFSVEQKAYTKQLNHK